MKRNGFLNAFWLKLLMAALMLLDHLYYNLFTAELYVWHLAARVVAPMFAYFLSEGMIHTRNRSRYIGRLFGFAGVMAAGNVLLFALFGRWIGNSILVELGLAALIIVCADRVQNGENPALWLVAIVGLFAVSLVFEGKFIVPAIALVFYVFREKKFVGYAVFIGLCSFTARLFPEQIYMMFAIVPIMCYNGRRGPDNAFARYFFYVFYPVHLWVIFLIEQYAK